MSDVILASGGEGDEGNDRAHQADQNRQSKQPRHKILSRGECLEQLSALAGPGSHGSDDHLQSQLYPWNARHALAVRFEADELRFAAGSGHHGVGCNVEGKSGDGQVPGAAPLTRPDRSTFERGIRRWGFVTFVRRMFSCEVNRFPSLAELIWMKSMVRRRGIRSSARAGRSKRRRCWRTVLSTMWFDTRDAEFCLSARARASPTVQQHPAPANDPRESIDPPLLDGRSSVPDPSHEYDFRERV